MTEVNQNNDNFSQPQSEAVVTNHTRNSNEFAINEGINRTVDAIVDLAMNKISDEQERQLIQSDVAGILRDSLHDLVDSKVELPNLQPPVIAQNIGNIGNAATAGIEVAKEVQNLGFVDFTAGLINGTFDAIIGSTIKQMQAYTELVANLAKTLKQFEAENVSSAQVKAHLVERYPDPDDNSQTVVRQDYKLKTIPEDKNNAQPKVEAYVQFARILDALIAETVNLEQPLSAELLGLEKNGNATSPYYSKKPDQDGQTTQQFVTTFETELVTIIHQKISESLAQRMIDHLREMAREGMARIVISDGEILSKLTFKVTSTEVDRKAKSEYERQQFNAYIRGRASWGWGRVSAGASYSKLNVKAVNESSFDSLTMSTEIVGQVRLRFRTETFAPVGEDN